MVSPEASGVESVAGVELSSPGWSILSSRSSSTCPVAACHGMVRCVGMGGSSACHGDLVHMQLERLPWPSP